MQTKNGTNTIRTSHNKRIELLPKFSVPGNYSQFFKNFIHRITLPSVIDLNKKKCDTVSES